MSDQPFHPDQPFRGEEPDGKTSAWIVGFAEAERRFYDMDEPDWRNPFREGSEQHAGFEEGIYTFTQK